VAVSEGDQSGLLGCYSSQGMAGFWEIITETLVGGLEATTSHKRRRQPPQRASVGIVLCAGGFAVAAPSAVRLIFIGQSGGLVLPLVIGVLAIAGGVAVLAGGKR
jgi:hypothetical protein